MILLGWDRYKDKNNRPCPIILAARSEKLVKSIRKILSLKILYAFNER